MKLFIIYISLLCLSLPTLAQDTSVKAQMDVINGLIKSEDFVAAASRLLQLSKQTNVVTAKPQIKYQLGVVLMKLDLNQVAAFQFVDVIRSGDINWTTKAIEKLLVVTDLLGDETLLNFVIQRVEIEQIPANNREMLYYRLADTKHKSGQQEEAIPYYKRVTSKSRYYFNALYNLGLAQAELNQTDEAIKTFNRLLAARSKAKVNDTNRVAAQIAIARVYYQQQNWNKSIEAYSKIPKDHALWHAALFEKTWAMLRSARFRSTLSNFQSLHSSYYEDSYLPETLLLRAIVYLYICQYDEMEKVLSLFDSQYLPALKKVNNFIKNDSLDAYYQQVNTAIQIKNGTATKKSLELPYNIMKQVSSEGDVRRSYAYLRKISAERALVESDRGIKNSILRDYAMKILNNRIKSTRAATGNLAKKHLTNIKNELTDLSEQSGFIRYEMLNGRKELLKKRIDGKAIKKDLAGDDKQDREFYVKNGYEFYPFQGEYWLDEVGNYHYLGRQSCE